jgi:hypothetical protein
MPDKWWMLQREGAIDENETNCTTGVISDLFCSMRDSALEKKKR